MELFCVAFTYLLIGQIYWSIIILGVLYHNLIHLFFFSRKHYT